MTDIEYWDKAAADPNVDEKFICNLPDDECFAQLGNINGPVLDIGCGVGRLTPYGEYGVDLSPEMIKIAEKRKPESHFSVCKNGVLPFKDKTFATVFSVLVFQHIDLGSVESYIREAHRILRHRGVLIFQFIAGEHSSFVNYNHKSGDIMRLLADTGFTDVNVTLGAVHPQWTWVRGIKK
jgi:SAM-dependent methyltransferase